MIKLNFCCQLSVAVRPDGLISGGGFIVTGKSVMAWVLALSLEKLMGHVMIELNQRGI